MLKGIRKKALFLLISGQAPAQPSQAPAPARYDKVLDQVHDFEIALQAMDFLLDDRSEEGTRLLSQELRNHNARNPKEPAAILPLARGVMQFIEATLGFETEVMDKAHKSLSEAEEASLAHAKLNQKQQLATSHIYPPGTEFQVTYAELTLLNALVMLLHENNGMVEQAKALFKLRRAYQILDATYRKIKELEGVFNRNLAKFKKQALTSSVSSVDLPGYSLPDVDSSESLADDIRLMKNLEKVYQMRKSRIEGTAVGHNVHGSLVNLFHASTLLVTLSTKLNSPFLDRAAAASCRTSSPVPANAFARNVTAKLEKTDDDDEDDDEFSDANDTFSSSQASTAWEPVRPNPPSHAESVISADTSSSSVSSDAHLHVSTIDEFIHSGVQLCFGILQVVLSLIPPTIGKVLSIVGFKGNNEIGLNMLWRTAITARNIHGELALLCLLVFYDGPIQFIDVGFQLPGHEDGNVGDVISLAARSSVSDAELEAIIKNPNLYTPQLLVKARDLFPHNALWVLQEGRMLAAQGNIHMAIEIMQGFTDNPQNRIQMEQVEALLTFDRAMFYAFVHDYDLAARDFVRMVDINSWSQAVYLFLAGACYLEKWRMIKLGEVKFPDEAAELAALEKYAEKANHYLQLAPTYVAGHGVNAAKKKGGIGGSNKQMPFDKFVLRKTKHIEDRHRKWPHLMYLECVGTSLIHELVYFWNGYNRMTHADVEVLHRMLDFSTSAHAKFDEPFDEAMIRHFFGSLALRQMGKVAEGLDVLQSEVISKYVVDAPGAPFKFNKMTYSPYLYPTAIYETAMFVWMLKAKENPKAALAEGISWLKKAEVVSDVGDYELSNRTSMRIKSASERLELQLELV